MKALNYAFSFLIINLTLTALYVANFVPKEKVIKII